MHTEQPPKTEENASPFVAIPRPYLIAALSVAGLLLIVGLVGAGLSLRRPVDSPAPQSVSNAAATIRAVTPTTIPSELPPPNSAVQAQVTQSVRLPEPTATALPAALPLPTVTPTPELPPAAPRDIVTSGSTTMRLALSGEGFDSTGRPLRFEIQPRIATLGGDAGSASDTWCIQLGLVHEAFDLTMSLEPATEDLIVAGTIALRDGFCEQPGEEMDRVDVSLSVPTGAAGQISYNLRGQRSLFGLSGLLDTDTGAIVELRVANTAPE